MKHTTTAPIVLVTGGAGFIGSHTVDELVRRGYRVRVLDSLQPRVHPSGHPEWLNPQAEFLKGDVADRADLSQALKGVEAVLHLAAYQDYMPDFSRFVHVNAESTALLFELIVSDRRRYPVRKIVFASSQSVCGEGLYFCSASPGEPSDSSLAPDRFVRRTFSEPVPARHGIIQPAPRLVEQLRRGSWEISCPHCGQELEPLRIPESIASPHTAYAISKLCIELLAERLGKRYDIPTVCMRYTYVQGTRNSFYNAYSGIARRFALRLILGLPPIAYEDGGQLRDYVNVKDVARANCLVLEQSEADFQVFNVGGGRPVTVLEFARMMLRAFGSDLVPVVPGEFRVGDTRHTVSDISRLQALGWEPLVPVEQNVSEFVGWMREQSVQPELLLEAERLMREQGVVQCAAGRV